MKFLKSLLLVLSVLLSTISLAEGTPTYLRYGSHPFYIGGLLGYGSTDWSQMTANCGGNEDCESDVEASVPTAAGDSGAVIGLTMGYEVQPHFAFETSFMRFPTTKVTFTGAINYPASYPFNDLGNASYNSYTYAYDFIGKFMVPIMNTSIRAFADAGMAITHRTDPLNTFFHVNPTFGVGLDYVFAEHWMVDGEFQYIAGYAKTNTTPAVSYSPFLYSLHLVLAYRF